MPDRTVPLPPMHLTPSSPESIRMTTIKPQISLHVSSSLHFLPRLGRAILEAADFEVVALTSTCAPLRAGPTLHLPIGAPPALAERIAAALAPWALEIESTSSDTLRLELGAPPFAALALSVRSNEASLLGEVCRELEAFFPLGVRRRVDFDIAEATLQVDEGYQASGALLKLYLRHVHGVEAVMGRPRRASEPEIVLTLPSPALVGLSADQIVPIRVVATSEADAASLVAGLRVEGFVRVSVDTTSRSAGRFMLRGGALSAHTQHRVTACVVRALDQHGLDPALYPVEEHSTTGDVELHFPIAAVMTGSVLPWGPGCAGRYPVELCTDDPRGVRELAEELRARGHEVTLAPFDGNFEHGVPALLGDAIFNDAAVLSELESSVARFLLRAGVDRTITSVSEFNMQACAARLLLPLRALRDGLADRADARRRGSFDVVVEAAATDSAPVLEALAALRGAGFESARCEVRPAHRAGPGTPVVRFGDVSPHTLGEVAAAVSKAMDAGVERIQDGRVPDARVVIEIPDGSALTLLMPSQEPPSPRPARGRSARPFVCEEPDGVRFGHVLLPRDPRAGHPLTPSQALCESFVVDQSTAEVLVRVAEAWAADEPLLLEGPTSASKTSAILFVAARLGHPVARLNLDGRADTSSLIGRIAPQRGGAWAWHEGLVPRSMREGLVLILDELSLAETAVLERLNPVLERPDPRLVLSEHDDEVVTPKAGFRLFATQNPVEGYGGRRALSPAFRDRWDTFRVPGAESEESLLQMVRALTHGGRPRVVVDGLAYAPVPVADAPPIWTALSHESVSRFLERLVSLHVALVRASRSSSGGLGSDRVEPYVWTRRRLLRVLRDADRRLRACDDSIGRRDALATLLMRHYVDPVSSEDRRKVLDLADAVGLGPSTWDILGAWPLLEAA